MRLARFEVGGSETLGIVVDEGIVDLAKAGLPFGSMLEIVAQGDTALDAIRAATEGRAADYALADVKLLAPLRPGKYMGIGMNFQKHIEEAIRLGVEPPKYQYWFNKQTTCINDPFGDIDPGVTEKLDYEVELGIVIGKPAKYVKAADALDHVFGYVVTNDVSGRDWQRHTRSFTVGKSFDTHGPIGPWIVTADEIEDPQNLNLRSIVNGELRQDDNTANMVYTIAEQIEYLSTAFTLESGDMFLTGTPHGVGSAMEPPSFLKPGDVVRCEIDGIGYIENTVVESSYR
ncbi:MAG: fumarylacetoacetate hydrolase family protein [Sphingomonadaceae bacterium]|nr:fumarylacetoacetate hydrolase family protein [Sphingomonadaceae bacterium]MCP5390865.1 fumarylacetoacetate hydrolase family protein [Sphingomonadaceae bacterium]MCP5394621.1 fumarylacetoacetate hydrolase family protein [Sphingomonadaceae bacterium]